MTGCACVLLMCVLIYTHLVVGLACFWWCVCIVMSYVYAVCLRILPGLSCRASGVLWVYCWVTCDWALCMSCLVCYLWLVHIWVFMNWTRLVILPPQWVLDTGDRNPQISRVCACAWEREICMCVWGLLTFIYDLNYLLMWPSSKVTSTDITNAPSDCFL